MALLAMNLTLLLQVFFLILLGMLLGLTLMVTNFQGLFEIVFSYMFFFWEKKSLMTILRKNMKAHKKRNKLTSIIYALSLGCIIFLLTAAHVEVETISNGTYTDGSDITIKGFQCESWNLLD
jgi:hypothetical protein